MANTKTACRFLVLLLLALLHAPPASSATGPRHDGPRPNNGMPWFGAFYGMPWFGGDALVRPSTVCTEPGPCHGKRLTCPARCFRSYSYTSEDGGGGGGGGGGGCSFDCTKRCEAYC
jgi:hypothetical protein